MQNKDVQASKCQTLRHQMWDRIFMFRNLHKGTKVLDSHSPDLVQERSIASVSYTGRTPMKPA